MTLDAFTPEIIENISIKENMNFLPMNGFNLGYSYNKFNPFGSHKE